jgi:hypothetical protein
MAVKSCISVTYFFPPKCVQGSLKLACTPLTLDNGLDQPHRMPDDQLMSELMYKYATRAWHPLTQHKMFDMIKKSLFYLIVFQPSDVMLQLIRVKLKKP